LAQRDLLAVIEASGVECPAVMLFSDAEKILGFREFLSLVPKDKRDQRLGKPIPLALNQAAEKRADIMRRTIYWQCAELIPKLITRTFQIRTIDPASGAIRSGSGSGIDARTNRQLVRLIGTMWARRRVMGDLCTRILGDNTVRPLRLAGCYFAATGSNRNSQGFLAELFAQIFEGQNFVVWTHDAARAETTLMRVVYTGYALTALVTVATLALAAVVWHQS
jgi:type VI protein secretion system component VasK